MSCLRQLLIAPVLILALAACQESGTGDTAAAPGTNAAATDALAEAAPALSSSTIALFDDEMSKKGCELLTAEMVSKTFDVPAEGLKQFKIMGCRYDWNNDQETVESGISMIQVHKSEAAAAGWFASATRNKTTEEMEAEMAQVAERMQQREELDSDVKKSTAKTLLAMVNTDAIQFEDVADVGDEARVSSTGTVYVRDNNLTFMVTAYKGPMAPPMDMQGVDLKQMVQRAKEHADQWAAETAAQRQADAARLARAIAEGL